MFGNFSCRFNFKKILGIQINNISVSHIWKRINVLNTGDQESSVTSIFSNNKAQMERPLSSYYEFTLGQVKIAYLQ